ncbi:MAG: SoxR reducing system RseC family protein [Bacteroidales bacterium]|nr:SoxR reducing system RseC family protein [Bacteroidales bacterium]
MSNETISHEGIITEIGDDELKIKILSKSACAACHAKSACTMSDMTEKILTVPKPQNRDFQLMQRVNVSMKVSQGNKAAILGYLLPFALMMAVLFTLIGCGLGEGLSALCSLAALIPYYIILYLRRDKLKKQFDYEIE